MRAQDPGGASAVVSARPELLFRFANEASTRTRGLEAAITTADAAVSAWNAAPCDPEFAVHVRPPNDELVTLAGQWTLADNFVADVATAFIRADASGGAVRIAPQSAVDQKMSVPPNYNPFGSLQRNDPALWNTLVGAMCYRNGGRYEGGGFLIGPDGQRYPLVIPGVPGANGLIYNADDGGTGDIATLDGADPGWYTVGTYQGTGELYPTHSGGIALSAFLLGLFGGSAGPADLHAGPGDYQGLTLGPGRPRWYAHGAGSGQPGYGASGVESPKGMQPSLGPGSAALTGVQLPLNGGLTAADQVEQARNRGYGAYRLVLERNVDGRMRAQLTQYEILKDPENTQARVIVPVGISVDHNGSLQGATIKYRPHIEPSQPTAEPAPSGEYHIFDHFKNADGFFDNPDYPVKFAYQDR